MFLSQLKAALAALRARLEDLETEKRSLADETTTLLAKPAAETRNLDAAETARFQEIVARSAAIPAEVADIERQVGEHEQQIAYLESVDAARSRPTAPNFNRTHEPVAPPDVRNLSRSQAREAAKRKIDECPDAERQAILDKMIRTASPRRDDGLRSFDGDEVARMMLITESDAYRSAFMKGITTQSPAWTADEVRALNEVRAMQAYTNAGGGFGVPIFIDPTIIITTSTNRSPILDVARIENITTTAWKGVSGAGAAWSFDAESAAVSDDSVTLAQPSVTAHMARGFIPFSMEFEDDYPNGAGELGNVLDVGYHDLLASKLINGTGTAEPWGIVAALDANTNVEVTPTTDGAFGAVDIDKVWKSLPERWRRKANTRWLMHVDVENEIRGFGSGTATSRFTVDQTADGISLLNGRPVILSDYCAEFTGTTGASNILVVGDFNYFLVAQRVGMTVELVSHLVDVTNNRPTGERGWFARARIGSDSILDNALRLLQNQ